MKNDNKNIHILYMTECLITGEVYIGKHTTNNINDNYLGSGIILKNKIKKYGRSNFNRTIIEIDDDEKTIYLLEELYVPILKTIYGDLCMNISMGGLGSGSGENHPMYGRTGELNPMFGRTGENSPLFGRKHSEETKKKMSELQNGDKHSMFGTKHSEEHKSKIKETSIKNRKLGEDHHNYGRKHSEETKKKMSELRKGRKFSEEHYYNLIENNYYYKKKITKIFVDYVTDVILKS